MSDQKPTSTSAGLVRNPEDPCETPPVAATDDEVENTDENEASEKAPEAKRAKRSDPKLSTSKKSKSSSKRRDRDRDRPARVPALAKDIDDKSSVPLAPIAHLVFVVAAAVGVYSFVSVAKEGEMRRRCTPTCILRPNYAGYEKKAPNFTLKDTRGHDISLDQYRGKVVVLNFWTKTCGPCMEEMPEIADLSRILKPMDDVAVVTVSTDDTAQEANDTLKSVLREEAPFPVLMDPDAKTVRGKFGTSLYPETWIIDKEGVIRARFDGAREWSSATVVELVNQIRGGGYCPVQARDNKFVGESARICEGLSGG
jgi:peroxiredoxin